MTDAEYMRNNYDAWLDEVLTNQDADFWSVMLGQGTPEGLQAATFVWRERRERDPVDSERWYDAIDRDEAYQEAFK
jgi:hypothetical protein